MNGGCSKRYRVEIRKDRRSAAFDYRRYPGFRYVRTGSRSRTYHWEAIVGEETLAEVRAKAKADRFEVRAVPVEYTRSSSCRRRFLEATEGPYRCRYCNRELGDREVKVDHVVSVGYAQRSAIARGLLHLIGASDVNDLANLAPACARCNDRKGDKGGLWLLRGFLGRYRAWWALIYLGSALCLLGALALLTLLLDTYSY